MSTRGLPVEADDLLITTGSQQALGLIAMTLLNPGDVVLVEDPTYLAALQAFQLADLRPVAIPCDEDGPIPDALIETARTHGAKVAYLIPTFQNPTGPHDVRRAAPGHRRGRRGGQPVAGRGRPVQRAAARRRAGRPARGAARRARPHDRHPDAVQGPLAGPADRVRACAGGAARPARGRQAGRRPAHLDRRPDGRGAVAGEPRPRRRTSQNLGAHYRPRRDALLAGLQEHLPGGLALDAPRGRPVHLDRAAGRLRRRERARPRDRARRRVRPRPVLLRGRAAARDAAGVLRHGDPAELHEGAARLGAAIAG